MKEDLNVDLHLRMDFIAEGRALRRYHTLDMLDYQRIDAHSFGVAMFTTIIAPRADWERRGRLLMAALAHDLPEHCCAGDVPAPAKRRIVGLRDKLHEMEADTLGAMEMHVPLSDADKRVLALADSADGAAHCIVERRKGNVGARGPFLNFWSYLTKEQNLGDGPELGEKALRSWIGQSWTRANGKEW